MNKPKLTEAQRLLLWNANMIEWGNTGSIPPTVARMLAAAVQAARAACWDEGWDAGSMDSDGDPQNPYRYHEDTTGGMG